ncbi:hypothetical protein A9Q78_06375 [Methylophaga sp. 41_12_T18]|nr:hypothetical protein A9Q78_06375 [Methylophaga sp. 41_12_T18]
MDNTCLGLSSAINKFWHALFISFTSLLFFSSSALADHWHSNAYIADSFIKIALPDNALNKVSGIKKWQQPIYYKIQHNIADQALHERLVALHFSQLTAITGLKIQAADSRHPANLTVVLTSEQHYQRDIGHYFQLSNNATITNLARQLGAATLFTRQNGSIQQAAVVIPTDRARAEAKLLSSLSEMLTQVVGLSYRSLEVSPSILNKISHNDFLSGLDYLLLKLLYDKRVKSGISAQQAKKIVDDIIIETDFQQYIQQADLTVKQQGLYPLLN